MLGRLAVTSFGSYLTVILVDLSFRRKEDRERERIKRIALERLAGTINSHIEMLSEWYIAALEEEPEFTPESYPDLFNEEYIRTTRRVDFSKNYPTAGNGPDPTWLDMSGQRMESFSEDVEDTISNYGIYMEPEMIKTVQNISDSGINQLFQNDIIQSDQRIGATRDCNLLAGEGVDYFLAKHLNLILEVIQWYDQDPELHIKPVVELDAWRDDVTPNVGSARLEKKLEESKPKFGMGPSYPVKEYHDSNTIDNQ